jgi:hypothetical protein
MYLLVGSTEVTDSPKFLALLSDRGCPLAETPIVLFTTIYLFPLNFGFDANFFALNFQIKTYCVPQTSSSNKTIQLDMPIDINRRVGNITDKTFSPYQGQKYLTDITRTGIPALFLLE